MTQDASDLLPFGPLDILEVYFEHDGPKFFALRAPLYGLRILVLCIDDGDEEDGVVTYLYLPLSPERFLALRSGRIPLREAFATQHQRIWRVCEDYRSDVPSVSAEEVDYSSLTEADLPEPGAVLELQTVTAAPLSRAELADRAVGARRTVAAFEVEAANERATEFPLRGVGRVSLALQDTLDALALEDAKRPNARGANANDIAADVQVSVVGLRAASFAVLIGSSPRDELLVNPRLDRALEDLLALIQWTTDPNALIALLYQYDRRARARFVNLLDSVGAYGSGVALIAAHPTAEIREAHASSQQVVAALNAIGSVTRASREVEISRGMLTASHTSRHTFELIDAASGAKYPGSVAPSARDQIEGLNVGHESFVSATLVVDTEFAAEDDERGRKVTLTRISPVD